MSDLLSEMELLAETPTPDIPEELRETGVTFFFVHAFTILSDCTLVFCYSTGWNAR